jgi:hypothetical protein
LRRALAASRTLLFFPLGHLIFAEKVVDFEFILSQTFAGVTLFLFPEFLGKPR